MLLKEYPFSLPTISNLVKKIQGQIVQNDADSNKLRIQLTNEQNKAFDITGYTTVTISVLKPDGTSSIDSIGTHLSVLDATKGIIEVTLRLSAIDVVGMCQATIEVYQGAKRLTSARFSFDVIPDIGGNSDPSGESNLPILQALIVDVQEALVRAENVKDGAQGIDGEKGETGEGLAIIEEIDNESLLPALGVLGDAYLVGVDKDLYIWTVSGVWRNVGPIKGPQGIQGPQGEQGIQGIQGPQGEPGVATLLGNDLLGETAGIKALDYAQGKVLNDKLSILNGVSTSVAKYGANKNSSTIQLAINDVESLGGGIVYVPNGIYSVNEIIKLPSNIKIIGVGNVTFKRMADISAILMNRGDTTTGGYLANKNIQVENITFDANNTAYTSVVTNVGFGHATNVKIINCKFTNCATWHELEINGCKNVLVENCVFENYTGTSEVLQLDYMGTFAQYPWDALYDDTPCTNITIKGCYFTSVSRSKIAIGNHTFKVGVTTQDVRIENNIFESFFVGVNLHDVSFLNIYKNRFLTCTFGVYFYERSNDVFNWNIVENYYLGGPISGEERFFRGENTVLTKVFANILIKANEVRNCNTNGIGFTATKNVKIIENTILDGNSNGIYLYGADNVLIADNICLNNYKGDVARTDIMVGNNGAVASSNVVVTGNRLGKYSTGTNTSNVLVENNIIGVSIANTGGTTVIHRANMINGVMSTDKTEIPFPFNSGFAQSDSQYSCKIVKDSSKRGVIYCGVKKTDGTNFATNTEHFVSTLPSGYLASINSQASATPSALNGSFITGNARVAIYNNGLTVVTSVSCPAIFFTLPYDIA